MMSDLLTRIGRLCLDQEFLAAVRKQRIRWHRLHIASAYVESREQGTDGPDRLLVSAAAHQGDWISGDRYGGLTEAGSAGREVTQQAGTPGQLEPQEAEPASPGFVDDVPAGVRRIP